MLKHHEIFDKFKCWEGYVDPGFTENFLGVMTKVGYFITDKPESFSERRHIVTDFPPFSNEEYFEWIDLLEVVTSAKGQFRMIELGAGYGRWLANAVAALRQVNNLPYELIGVEAEPTHFKWLKEHLEINNVDLPRCQLIQAAVSGHDGNDWFYVGRADEWYGQAIASSPSSLAGKLRALFRKTRVQKVESVSLNTLLRPLTGHVDLIDLDVQGAEFDVLEKAAEEIAAKVKRVHIGTHGSKMESGLRNLFNALKWEQLNDYPCGRRCQTPWGTISFQDGVQTYINPRLQTTI
jgi:FkbM family methyltransferase